MTLVVGGQNSCQQIDGMTVFILRRETCLTKHQQEQHDGRRESVMRARIPVRLLRQRQLGQMRSQAWRVRPFFLRDSRSQLPSAKRYLS